MENIVIQERLRNLRRQMKEEGIDFYIIPTEDYHNSEYVDGFFKAREYFSGFTGSAGTLIVSDNEAGLWTDGRYFIQADKELQGTGITLFRSMEEGVPTTTQYLEDHMKEGQILGFDGRVMPAATGEKLQKKLAPKSVGFVYERDLAEKIWEDRPALPCHPVMVLPEELCGLTLADKVASVREKMREKECGAHLLAKLDDLMWLFNIRGFDVSCNPVALAFGFVTMEEIHLFIQRAELDREVCGYFDQYGVTVHDYHEITSFLKTFPYGGSKVLLSKEDVNFTLYRIVTDRALHVCDTNPTEALKAVKNETELSYIRDIYIKDSAVLTKYIFKMKKLMGEKRLTKMGEGDARQGSRVPAQTGDASARKEDAAPLNEYTAGKLLDEMRAEIPGFLELSFDTICAYQENAAMMHYEATERDNKGLKAEGMLLVDSGGQYLGGTTDVTRTFALGPVTDKMKEHFTAVAVGMLRLANAKFLYGCTGRNVDILARQPLWEKGIDYKCGTGHGIGYILNVHEGPQNIRWRYTEDMKESLLEPGMIVSDEPGVYLEGEYGIRTENILEIVNTEKNGDGQFMVFKMLTYVPIDLDLIDTKWMEPKDIELLNKYHRDVYEKLAPFMDEEELELLKDATRTVK